MSEDNVYHVKTTLLDLLKHISNKSNPVYALIYNCVNEFYVYVQAETSYMSQSNGDDPISSWRARIVYHPQVIANIQIRVIPWLGQAKSDEASVRTAFGIYYDKFVALCTYVDSNFAPRAPVRPAPPSSNPTPPATERATSDTFASLQHQVLDLQKQINVLELTKMEFKSDQKAYKVDREFFNEEIKKLNQVRNDDKESFDSQIATVQRGVDSLSAISARVATLENLVTTLQQKQVKPKSWFGSEQVTLLDSRPETYPHEHLSTLLHEMHDLNMDHS